MYIYIYIYIYIYSATSKVGEPPSDELPRAPASFSGDHANHPHPHPEHLLRFTNHVNMIVCYIMIRHFEFRKCLKMGVGVVCVVPIQHRSRNNVWLRFQRSQSAGLMNYHRL